MKRILLLLLLPLLTVVWVQAATTIVEDGVTYEVYKSDDYGPGRMCYVSNVDASLDTIAIHRTLPVPPEYSDNIHIYFCCDSVKKGVFDNHQNLRVLKYALDVWWQDSTVHSSPGFKGCVNLEKIEPLYSRVDDHPGFVSADNGSLCFIYDKDRKHAHYAVPTKHMNFFSTNSTWKVLPRCFAGCDIKTLEYNATYIPDECFDGFKGRIVFKKEIQGGEDVFRPLSQLAEEAEIDVASQEDYVRARKYFEGKITVRESSLIRIVPDSSGFFSINFHLDTFGSVTLADVQKVTILNGSSPFDEIAEVTLTPDGKYVINNLEPGTSYIVLTEYKDEHGNDRTADDAFKTRDVGSLKAKDVSKEYWIAGAEMRINDTASEDKLEDLSQSEATYGIRLTRMGKENGQTVYYETYESTDVSEGGYCFIKGLKPGCNYEAEAFIKYNDKFYWGQKSYTHTNRPELYCYHKSYPTAIEFFESKSESDKTYDAKRVFCYENEKCTTPLRERIVWLDPGESFPVWLKIDDSDLADYVVKKFVYAADVNFNLEAKNVTATTAYMNFSYEKAEKYEPELRFEFLGKPIEESGLMTGLVPNQQYVTKYKAINVETGKEFQSKEIRFTTKPLTLETEVPKIPSAGNMIARATTNISELEPNVGFQWKKYDAPESLKPSEGFAVAHGGVLEGTIHNLQIDHYYNVRAFYRDMNGKEYYGKWITVDPSDFSWFEPNVHTYDVDRVTTNGAKARGYVVQGTDDIEKQGFEYWPSGDTSKRRVAYGTYAPADNGRQTILATGQLMTAELADLLSATEYTVRSFVTTSASTYYGEEITFRTLEASGIEGVAVDEAEIVPVAYYRLDGTRGERPFPGLNMVVFSDGHVEKIVFK